MTAVKKLKEDVRYTYDDYVKWDDDWEVIDGKAYAMSPSASKEHHEIAGKIHIEIGSFLKGKQCKVYFEFDVMLSKNDVVRPDIIVVCDKNKIERRGIKGAPDFVVEILSPATAKRDKTIKLELYRKYGVKEYWIVDPYNCNIEVHYFDEKKVMTYFLEPEEEENIIPVGIFGEELKLDMKYLFEE